MMPNSDPRDGFFNPTLTLMIDSYNLQQGISGPVINADLVYKFSRIVGKTSFPDQIIR